MTTHIPQSKCYAGERVLGRAVVTVHLLSSAVVTSYPLAHAVRHSPDGFNWGYRGSGPSDLARSVLMECLGEDPPPALPRLQGALHRPAPAGRRLADRRSGHPPVARLQN
jgi:hypothetical protein